MTDANQTTDAAGLAWPEIQLQCVTAATVLGCPRPYRVRPLSFRTCALWMMPIRLRPRTPGMAVVATVLLLVGMVLGFRWWDRSVEDGLARWAVNEFARRTDNTSRLVLGDLSLRPLSGSLSTDSAIIITDSARNSRRTTRLPAVHAHAYGCVLSGVDVLRLFFRQSLDARLLSCRRVTAGLVLTPQLKRNSKQSGDTLAIKGAVIRLARPLGLSLFRITQISFPALSFSLRRPGPRGGTSAVLEQARFDASDLVFDPTADPRSQRVLSARRAHIAANGLVLRPDTLSKISIARLDAGLTDSTLRLAGARHGPSLSDEELVRTQRARHDRVRFKIDRLRARGVAYRSLLANGDLDIRAVELRGATIDVLSDKRIPTGPPRHHRIPQHAAASVSFGVAIDTVHIGGLEVTYQERKPEHERAGRVSLGAIRGKVLHLDLPGRGKPLRIDASARLMNEGLLSVHATVPLNAPDFRYELEGTLGPMQATAFNRFLAESGPIKVARGRVDGIEFQQVAARGRATTTLTPRYRDLSFESSDSSGGVLSSVKHAVVKLAASKFKVRSENPEDDGKKLHTAKAVRVYDPSNSWIQFLWFGFRDGFKAVVMK